MNKIVVKYYLNYSCLHFVDLMKEVRELSLFRAGGGERLAKIRMGKKKIPP